MPVRRGPAGYASTDEGTRYHRFVLVAIIVVFLVFGVGLGWFGVRGLRRRRFVRTSGGLLACLLCLAVAALFSTLSVSTMGYRALTHEEVVVVVDTVPVGAQRFRAVFRYPDGVEKEFVLSGDELYVDARILKWKPWANVLGLHTGWELDRVAGRYVLLEDERTKHRTVSSLAEWKPFDMFDLRRGYPVLAPLVDAEYGSGTFAPADRHARFEIRVGTSGLLIREAGEE